MTGVGGFSRPNTHPHPGASALSQSLASLAQFLRAICVIRMEQAEEKPGGSADGGRELARFQGDAHAGSDRAAATVLFLALLIALLVLAWWATDPAGFNAFWANLLPDRQ